MDWQEIVDREKDLRAHVEEEESAAEAQSRMLPAEIEADLEYPQLVERRAQPLKARAGKGQWGTWRKRKAGSVARRARAGR